MNFHATVTWVAGLSLLLFSAAETRAFAQAAEQSPATPVWLAGRGDLLPPITAHELNKMEKAWSLLQVSDVMGNEPPEYWHALQTVVELDKKASLALVWLYAKDPPRLNPSVGIRNSRLVLRTLSDDTISESWLLPLLRFRLQWMEGLLSRREHAQLEALIDEIPSIQGYMNSRGEEGDYRMVMDFIAKLGASSEVARQRLSMLLEPKYDAQARADDEWRKRTRPQLYAYHEMAKLTLTARGGDLTKAAKLLSGQIDSLSWAFPQASAVPTKTTASMQGASNHATSAATTKKPTASTSEEPASSTPWSIIIVLLVVATGLLWLLVKNRK
jgi:hypothetical protein